VPWDIGLHRIPGTQGPPNYPGLVWQKAVMRGLMIFEEEGVKKLFLFLLILFVGVFVVSAAPLYPEGEPQELSAGFSVDAVLTEGSSIEALQVSVLAGGIDEKSMPRQAPLAYVTNTSQLQTDSLKQLSGFYLLC
jgi:hypothetical protein